MENNKGISPRAKIIIADDKEENIIVLEKIISDLNCDTLKANSGNEVLEIVSKQEVALILLDVLMPGMDGFKTAELIHENEETKEIPIIFVTAMIYDYTFMLRGYNSGAVDYLFKPVDSFLIKRKVTVFLQLYYQKKEIESLLHIQEEISNNLIRTSSELQIANIKLDKISRIDPLTGLSNRRDFTERLEYERKRFDRTHKEFSLILGDIDGFKNINDTLGHDCGDFVLTSLAMIFKSILREHDIVSRWGGEEFLILLPETHIDEGKIIAERIREKIDLLEIDYHEKKIHVTMSFGVTEYRSKLSLNECINIADSGMYFAKTHGKNKVICKID